MSKHQIISNIICRTTALCLLAMLAACGGSDEEESQTSCFDNIIVLLICSALSSAAEAPDQAPVSTGNSAVTGMAQVDEYEPNNALDNANVVTLTEASDSLRLAGSLHGMNDTADHFVFTPKQSGAYRIYLCAETCDQSLEDDTSYIMIYDQNQTTIAATPVGTISEQKIEADLIVGMAYYVEVNGYNAGDADFSYRLVLSN